MTGLTARQVRVRAAVLVVLIGLTFLLLVLGMVFAGGSDWFLLLILVIDLPAMAVLFIVDWAERSRV